MTPEHGSTQDAAALRSRLKELKDSKAPLQAQLHAASAKIRELISQIKEKKVKRNALTDSVKKLKLDRGSLSKEIRDKIELVKTMRPSAPPARERGEPPGKIKARIDELNRKIETEAVSFEKEQQFMKQIKLLKAQWEEARAAYHSREESSTLSKEINDLKRKADAIHESMQVQARESQVIHEEILVLSKQVDELKKQESDLRKAFFAARKEYDHIEASLHAILSSTREKEAQSKEHHKRDEEDRTRKRLQHRISEVREKLKRGEKLTTEDVIVLQADEEDALFLSKP